MYVICADEYACLWNGCEFLSMGNPLELEIHAYFHNYHSKLKYVGSQLLKHRHDLPICNQGVHSNNLVPEGSEGYVCQWEHCDVCTFDLPQFVSVKHIFIKYITCPYRVHLTILSGSTDMWTITLKVLNHSLSLNHNNNKLCFATGQVRQTFNMLFLM